MSANLQDALTRARSLLAEPALDRLVENFHLSPFERDILLLCAAMELDPEIPALCAAAQNDERLRYPNFRLALTVLPEAHWNALLPDAPLRRWRLVEVGTGETFTASPLRIDETVLHFLMGVAAIDERLRGFLEPVDAPHALPASYRPHVEKLIRLWTQAPSTIVQLDGDALKGKRDVAVAACASLGLRLHSIRAGRLPSSAAERETLARLWERQVGLTGDALLLDIEGGGPVECEGLAWLADQVEGPLVVAGSAPLVLKRRDVVRVTIERPTRDEQRALWQNVLGEHAASLNGEMGRVAAQFTLDARSIRAAGLRVLDELPESGSTELFPRLWEACRAESRPLLEGLAQRIETRAGWADIVLPESSLDMLRAVAAHVRQQFKVLEEWGFAEQNSRGLGVTALFSGASGTGKTLAAEVLAGELRLDLYRIDLSQVVSKYIGETEKNLRAIFDAAETGGAILLFDEADALFGKRSEVRDSHDRYANIEVSYLLQRMEAYRGLAILTTNMRAALDPAFLRRIRYLVHFPFPDAALRRRIWERMFPPRVPLNGLDVDKLARLNLPGGNIHNIALQAAFLAAEDGGAVRMGHLLVAARRECHKLEKPLTEAETGGWV
jgi:hypothetical protein